MINSNIESLKGLSIRKCLRHFNSYDLDYIPEDLKELEADGTILLIFSNEITVKFSANTEAFSIEMENQITTDFNNFKDITRNKFWEQRIGKSIRNIEFLNDKLEEPKGIKFCLENNQNFTIEFVSESDYEFDAIIIRKA